VPDTQSPLQQFGLSSHIPPSGTQIALHTPPLQVVPGAHCSFDVQLLPSTFRHSVGDAGSPSTRGTHCAAG